MTQVTLADLVLDGKRLWLYCRECQFNRFVAPDTIGQPLSLPVPQVGARMMCPDCLSRNIHSKPEWYMGREVSGY